jgi:hypothetical protein
VIAPEPLAVKPVRLPVLTAVHVNTVPATSAVGIKFNEEPLQIFSVAGRFPNTGVGFTITLVVLTTGPQIFPFAVNVYTTVSEVVFVLLNVSVISPLAAAALAVL